MHGEDLLVNDGSDGQAVEAVCECLPEPDVVPSLAFVVEAVDTVDRSALVVAAKDEEVLGVFDLVSEQKADSLKRLLASVHVIAEEEIVGLRWESTVFEKPEEIVILTVNVATDLSGVSGSALNANCRSWRKRFHKYGTNLYRRF